MSNFQETAAPLVHDFLIYHESICGHSPNTVDAYYSDIKFFIGWIHLQQRPRDETALDDESITLEELQQIRQSDIYEYMTWLSRTRHLDNTTRARRLSAVKMFFRYLTVVTKQLKEDPTIGVQRPKKPTTLPKFLTAQQSDQLIDAASGQYELRDATILMLFLTCGLRVSELAGLDLDRISKDTIRVIGKGNKERMLYMSEAMQKQMRSYLDMRYGLEPKSGHEKAAFLSRRNTRISVRRIQSMVDEKLAAAGLDASSYSPHKLRHTAATVMLQNGVDVRVLQEVLGHQRLDTTQIYTHVTSEDLKFAAQANPIGKKR